MQNNDFREELQRLYKKRAPEYPEYDSKQLTDSWVNRQQYQNQPLDLSHRDFDEHRPTNLTPIIADDLDKLAQLLLNNSNVESFTGSSSSSEHCCYSESLIISPFVNFNSCHKTTSTVSSQLSLLSSESLLPAPPTVDITAMPFSRVCSNSKLISSVKVFSKSPQNCIADSTINKKSEEQYKLYRETMIEHIIKENGGFATKTNPKMRRRTSVTNNCNDNNKNEAYYELRRRNNVAAKQSRDRRRIRENELYIRAKFLDKENLELKRQLSVSLERESIAEVTVKQIRNEFINIINKMHHTNNL